MFTEIKYLQILKFVFLNQIQRAPVFRLSDLRVRYDQISVVLIRVRPNESAPAVQSVTGLAVVRGSVCLLDILPGSDEEGFGGSTQRICD